MSDEKIEYKHIEDLTCELKEFHWGKGEWLDEPDVFTFKRHGFTCLGRRIVAWEGVDNEHLFGGHWCGYIEIPKNHPWFGKTYDDIDIDCHGGITFCEKSEEIDDWIIGFDCAHSMDITPSMQELNRRLKENSPGCPWVDDLENLKKRFPNSRVFNQSYKTIDFVIEQCQSMADQAKEAMEKTND